MIISFKRLERILLVVYLNQFDHSKTNREGLNNNNDIKNIYGNEWGSFWEDTYITKTQISDCSSFSSSWPPYIVPPPQHIFSLSFSPLHTGIVPIFYTPQTLCFIRRYHLSKIDSSSSSFLTHILCSNMSQNITCKLTEIACEREVTKTKFGMVASSLIPSIWLIDKNKCSDRVLLPSIY